MGWAGHQKHAGERLVEWCYTNNLVIPETDGFSKKKKVNGHGKGQEMKAETIFHPDQ